MGWLDLLLLEQGKEWSTREEDKAAVWSLSLALMQQDTRFIVPKLMEETTTPTPPFPHISWSARIVVFLPGSCRSTEERESHMEELKC